MTALPEGPNRDLVSKVCQGCYDLQMVFDAAGISRGEWDMSLEDDRERHEYFGRRSSENSRISLSLSGSHVAKIDHTLVRTFGRPPLPGLAPHPRKPMHRHRSARETEAASFGTWPNC
jgi:hypothetical protein